MASINLAVALTGGSVFGIDSPAGNFKCLWSFDRLSTPVALIQGADDALYGTVSGGDYGSNTVFRLDLNGTGFTALKKFDHLPYELRVEGFNSLIQGWDEALYGNAPLFDSAVCDETAGGGDGMIFKLNPDGTAFTIVRTLASPIRGSGKGGLIQGLDGAIYSQSDLSYLRYEVNGCDAQRQAEAHVGTVFKVEPDGTGSNVLMNVDYASAGGYPDGPLTQGTDGVLYGTRRYGGTSFGSHRSYQELGYGTIFRLNQDGTAPRILLNFDSTTNGAYPAGGLTQGADGALYGLTAGGGSNGFGTIFKVNQEGLGFSVLLNFEPTTIGYAPLGRLVAGADGVLYGATSAGGRKGAGTIFKLRMDPSGTVIKILLNFDRSVTGSSPSGALVMGKDGHLYGTTLPGADGNGATVFRLLTEEPPAIGGLTPNTAPSGGGGFTLMVDGIDFTSGAVVQWNGTDLVTTFVSNAQLAAAVPNVPATSDIYTALITVRNPKGTVSTPEVFLVLAANVAEAASSVVPSNETASVSTAPAGTGHLVGIIATVTNSGDSAPVTVTAAIYSTDPSPGTSFGIHSATGITGEFMDLQVIGADDADTMEADFYYPLDAPESETSPTLKYYDGYGWADVVSNGSIAPAKEITDNQNGTVSGGKFGVSFGNSSIPKITELGGTFFAIAVPQPPLDFTGFLSPIGGSDISGGSFATPLKTFKAGSTLPVKFTIARGSTRVTTGAHRLQAVKYSDATTADPPIDATPQGAASVGNQFTLKGHEWHYNLDTRATGLTKGMWQLVATLSDGSQHSVWVQLK